MLEPKYDEDTVNLGYLKKVISDTEENIDDTYKNVSRHYASRPKPPYYQGDTWIDGDIVYTCINTRTIGLYQDTDWVTESGAKTEAERKNKTYLTQPSNYSAGDMWILQSDEDHRAGKKGEILISTAGRKEYDSDDWVNMLGYGTIKSINEVAGNLNNAINRIGSVEEAIQDGLIITFYQDTVPEGIHLGDLWYVTGELEGYTKGKIYRYDGTNWIKLDDPAIQEAFDEANEARLVADGKIQSFYSETKPTKDMGVGDLWIDIAHNNELYRYNGTNWVAVYDTRINDLVVDVETVTERVTTIETDLGEIDLKVEENTTKITTVQQNITNLQSQIDGAIQFWNGSDIPTINNYPANEWTTEEIKNNHRADIYTVIKDIAGELKQGKSYRFDKVEDIWQWIELTDNELSAVQALATSKAKVFITTPIVPYNLGDLWINGGKLYRCKIAKDNNGAYSENDWEEAVDYTDNTVANLAKTLADTAQNTADSAVEEINNITNTEGIATGKNIHLEDSSDEPLVSIKVKGETKQDTSPDYPSPIENVEGKNKFNKSNMTEATWDNGKTNTVTLLEDGRIQSTANYSQWAAKCIDIPNLKANTDYVVSGKIISSTADNAMIIVKGYKNNTLSNIIYHQYAVGTRFELSFNSSDYEKIGISLSGDNSTLDTTYTTIFDEIQLEEGTVATDYVQYNSLEIKDVGKNLLKISEIQKGRLDNGVLDYANNTTSLNIIDNTVTFTVDHTYRGVVTDFIEVKPNTTYIFSQLESGDFYRDVACYNSKKEFISNKSINSIVTPENCKFIRIQWLSRTVDTKTITSPQLEESTVATPYEPYQEQKVTFPLSEGQKLYEGSYLADDGLHHIRKQVVLDGTESWNIWAVSLNNVERFYVNLDAPTKNINTALCSHFKFLNANQDEEHFRWSSLQNEYKQFVIFIDKSKATTVAELKTWLQSNPVTVEYELAKPEIVPYTAEQQEAWNKIEQLHTYKNVTNIFSTAELDITYVRDNGLSDMYETKQNANKKYTETTQKLAEQKMTVDGVITQVSETNKRLTNDYLTAEQVNAELDTTKEDIEIIKQNQVTMTQTSKNLQIAIDTINNEGVSKVKTSMGYTFDDEGFKLNRSNAETGTIIDEAAVKVIDKTGASEQNLLYAGYVKEGNTNYPNYIGQTIVASANMIVQNYLVVPNSRFEEYTNPVLGGKGTGVFEV